jgi:plastocyanin
MRRLLAMSIVTALVVGLGAAPSSAGSAISIDEFTYRPFKRTAALGEIFRWRNDGTVPHTATQDAPLRFFNTGQLMAGATSDPVEMWAAGRFSYHCRNHPMYGLVKVPVDASSASIGLGDPVTIRLSSRMTFKGYTFDLQRKRNRGLWVTIETSIGTRSVDVTPRHTGRFRFRARVLDLDGDASGWSPAARVRVRAA